MGDRDIRTHDPATGDLLDVEDERFEVMERCPCGPEAQHIRWFLQGQSSFGTADLGQEAVLAKEWDPDGALWWWFGRRIALSDLRAGKERLPQRLRRAKAEPPKRLFYEGRLYRLVLVTDPPKDLDQESIP